MDANDIIQQMTACGLSGVTEDKLKIDGARHYFAPDSRKNKSKKSGWYKLFEFVGRTGDRLISGSFGNYYDNTCYLVEVSAKGRERLSPEEVQRLAEQQKAHDAQVKEEQRQKHLETGKRALSIWSKLPDSGKSDYLDRKKVYAHGLRFSKGSVVVPVYGFKKADEAGFILWGLQFINGDGSKKFLTGTAKKGRFFVIGEIDPAGIIGFAEGYATAATIHECMQWAMVVTFDAGNMLPVARVFRERYPDAQFVFCGDDDHEKEINTGRLAAEQAASVCGGRAIFPPRAVQS